MSGRPKTPLVLGATEREQLIALTKRRKTAQALALRARIVLACAEGLDNKVVAARLRVTQQTVSKWRGRFVELRMQGLLDAPCPLYTSEAADDMPCVDFGGRRILKKKKKTKHATR